MSTPSLFITAQAKAHDRELATATTALRFALDRVDSAEMGVHRAAGDRTGYHGARHATWGMSLAEAADQARAVAAGTVTITAPAAVRMTPQRAQAALKAHREALDAVGAARLVVETLEQVWRDNGRWSRFFVVPGGHIHSSTGCRSLHVTTEIGWLPELSGETEADAVSAYGSVLCTYCFPSAPVEWTTKAPKAADPAQCPGSGHYAPGANLRLCSPRGTCPECGSTVSVTSRGNARKHRSDAA
ncbi:hypothetical protein [Mycobacterium sp.]|uniref:hypothetical protein n=1 Tax=Mycobacterium sp. TaxID=1785 RepID=UPI0025D17266|nr:hypothetical protein [Mycobacterium sp.]